LAVSARIDVRGVDQAQSGVDGLTQERVVLGRRGEPVGTQADPRGLDSGDRQGAGSGGGPSGHPSPYASSSSLRNYFFLKKAQVSGRPRAPASCGPLTVVVPPLPTRFACTMRGDAPRWVTTMFRSLPWSPRPLSAELIRPSEYFRFQ